MLGCTVTGALGVCLQSPCCWVLLIPRSYPSDLLSYRNPCIKIPKINVSFIFLLFFWPLAGPKIAKKGAVHQSAASAASPDRLRKI